MLYTIQCSVKGTYAREFHNSKQRMPVIMLNEDKSNYLGAVNNLMVLDTVEKKQKNSAPS